jgi:hypothetical protein
MELESYKILLKESVKNDLLLLYRFAKYTI